MGTHAGSSWQRKLAVGVDLRAARGARQVPGRELGLQKQEEETALILAPGPRRGTPGDAEKGAEMKTEASGPFLCRFPHAALPEAESPLPSRDRFLRPFS